MNLIFDIGANAGKTVSEFILVADKVVCFEPNPTLANSLRSRFVDNSVIVDERGVSNKNGIQTFKISNADTISTLSDDWITNSRFTGGYIWDNHIEIETTTLDSIIDEYGIPDYIKIDVEGHEYEVLTSFSKLLPDTLFSFEWAEEQKHKIDLTIQHLNKLGYNSFAFTDDDEILFDEQINWEKLEDNETIEMSYITDNILGGYCLENISVNLVKWLRTNYDDVDLKYRFIIKLMA
jgi:FkbM family methyltransferase